MVIIEHEVESWRVGPRRRIWPRPVPGALTPACCVPGGSSFVFSSICTVWTRASHTARFVREQALWSSAVWRGRRRLARAVRDADAPFSRTHRSAPCADRDPCHAGRRALASRGAAFPQLVDA